MDFDTAWRIAGDPTAGDRADALAVLAANRDALPGVVFVSIPEGQQWSHITHDTDALFCKCGRWRFMLPTKPPELRLAGKPILVTPGVPLFIGFWGSDYQGASVIISVRQGHLAWQLFKGGASIKARLSLEEVIALLPQEDGTTLIYEVKEGYKVPLGRVTSVNPAVGHVYVDLGVAVRALQIRASYVAHSC